MKPILSVLLVAVLAMAASGQECKDGMCQVPTKAPKLPPIMYSIIEHKPVRTVAKSVAAPPVRVVSRVVVQPAKACCVRVVSVVRRVSFCR